MPPTPDDAASVTSSSTESINSVAKPEAKAAAAATKARGLKGKGRRLRQSIRKTVSDLGSPPTSRHDKEHGLKTPKHVDLGPLRAGAVPRT